ncbi:unnamed protein product [Coregonus sp. 'balchen']|nr:unnamed protein product [Coregonus sp. 'balchen']
MTAEEVTNEGPNIPFTMEGEDITQKKDGGVLKLVKQEGTGTELPMTGDKVFVHYVGTLLDGTPFDSSRERGEKFSFELGKGQVIKAWDLGVATMKVGEISQLICKPEYAYGTAGSPPKIPPNATLVFQVELFEFRGEDITEGEDGGIIRRIITKGEGYSKPNEGAAVEVCVEGSCEGKVFDQRELKFELGDGKSLGLPNGVEKALTAMEKGEESLFIIKPKYGYGNTGSSKYSIPGGATLQYKLKLTAFEKGEEQKARALRLAAHLNLAMCFIKLQEPSSAFDNCDKALELDEANEKALFRRGEALFAMKEFDRARADFQRVTQLYPSNKAAKSQVALCQKQIKEQHEKDKRLYANMFQKFAERDAKFFAINVKEERFLLN